MPAGGRIDSDKIFMGKYIVSERMRIHISNRNFSKIYIFLLRCIEPIWITSINRVKNGKGNFSYRIG